MPSLYLARLMNAHLRCFPTFVGPRRNEVVDSKNAPKVLELIRDLRVPGEASLLDHCYLEFSLATTYLI